MDCNVETEVSDLAYQLIMEQKYQLSGSCAGRKEGDRRFILLWSKPHTQIVEFLAFKAPAHLLQQLIKEGSLKRLLS